MAVSRRTLARVQLTVLYAVAVGTLSVNAYALYLQQGGLLDKIEIKPFEKDELLKARREQSPEALVKGKLATRGFDVSNLPGADEPRGQASR